MRKNNNSKIGKTICRGGMVCHPGLNTCDLYNGITLIALIITVIIMLILAGVTINIVINGGLFGQAEEAAKNMDVASAQEKIQTDVTAKMTERYNLGEELIPNDIKTILDGYVEVGYTYNEEEIIDEENKKIIFPKDLRTKEGNPLPLEDMPIFSRGGNINEDLVLSTRVLDAGEEEERTVVDAKLNINATDAIYEQLLEKAISVNNEYENGRLLLEVMKKNHTTPEDVINSVSFILEGGGNERIETIEQAVEYANGGDRSSMFTETNIVSEFDPFMEKLTRFYIIIALMREDCMSITITSSEDEEVLDSRLGALMDYTYPFDPIYTFLPSGSGTWTITIDMDGLFSVTRSITLDIEAPGVEYIGGRVEL